MHINILKFLIKNTFWINFLNDYIIQQSNLFKLFYSNIKYKINIIRIIKMEWKRIYRRHIKKHSKFNIFCKRERNEYLIKRKINNSWSSRSRKSTKKSFIERKFRLKWWWWAQIITNKGCEKSFEKVLRFKNKCSKNFWKIW
jgi:hypothetical protein